MRRSFLIRSFPALTLVPGLLLTVAPSGLAQTGVVRSGTQPIPGVTVTGKLGDKTITTVTGIDGRYTFSDAADGKGTIDVQMFGFDPQSKPAVFGPLGPNVDFNLQLQTSQAARRMAQFGNRAGQTDTADTQMQNEINTAQALPAVGTSGSTSNNESFLLSGSLSQGLAQNAPPDTGFGPPGGGFGQQDGGPGNAGAPTPGGAQGGGGGFGGGGGGFGGGGFGGGGGGGFGGGGGGGFGGPGGRPGQRAGARPGQFGNRRRQQAIHGLVFYTLNNSAVNAKPFSITGSEIPQPSYAQSRFGFVAGGPLVIPKLFKDPSTTFFISYFGTRSKNPSVAFSTVPTAAEHEGDFSQAVQSVNSKLVPVQIFDPTTHAPYPGNVIPQSVLNQNPIGTKLVSLIPLPNAPGLVNNYFYDDATIANTDNINARFQRNVTPKDRLAYHVSYQDRGGNNLQPFGYIDTTSGYGFSTDLTWSRNISPTVISNARVQFNRNRNETTPFFANGVNIAAELGIEGTSSNPLNYGPPTLNFTNFQSLSDGNPVLTRNQSQNASENVILIRGLHSITLGMIYARNDLSTDTDQNGRGTLNFTGAGTSQIGSNGIAVQGTGYDLADLLIGVPQSASIRYGDTSTYFAQNVWTGFVNDDWKVHSRLTLDLGVRYEYFSPYTEKNGRIANLDIAPNYSAVAVVTPGQAGPFSGSFPSGLINPQYHNFSPRVGLAWKVPYFRKSTIIRSGYGIYYNGQIYNGFGSKLAQQPPFATSYAINSSPDQFLTLANAFTSVSPQDITNTAAIARGFQTPYAQTWNFTIQRELARGIVTEVGYLGTKGTHLDVETLPNEGPGGLTALQRTQLGNAIGFTLDSSQGNSIYNALQVRIQQRFRRGVSWQLYYTYSKSIDDSSTFGGAGNTVAQNWLDLAAERGLSSFDRRHVLTGNWVLTSPIGAQGSRIQPDSRVGRLLKDWTLSGSVTAETGTPLTARSLGNTSALAQTGGIGSERADATGLSLSSGDGFFNTLAFIAPTPGTFGNAGRNTIPGPDSIVLNASFGRSFQFGESRRRLELRAEANNVLNQVNFTNVETVVNAINYGAAISAGSMRTLDVVLRFRF